MKKNALEHIIRATFKELKEQADTTSAIETDNAPSSAVDSPFTPAEERFLGKFDAYGSTHLGIIYSISDAGIREFVSRSGKDLNVTPGIILNLLRKKIIKLVPYTGFGRNDDYTIELQLSLDDVKGLGAADKEKAEKGSDAAGGADLGGGGLPEPTATPEPPAPENAGYNPKGTVLKETVLTEEFNNNQIKQAWLFWSFIGAATDSLNWDEDVIKSYLLKIKNKNDAIFYDAMGRIFFEFETTGNSKILKAMQLPMPELPKINSEVRYTLERLFSAPAFISGFIKDYGSDYRKNEIATYFNKIGVCRFNSVWKPFFTYNKNDVWNIRNQIANQYLNSK